ncbi:hypothetical protein KDW88_31680 [Burkholderia cenocepacia]|uniref:hypothetical protein n=1 Tax=Burkholderia cenocepacia TaxID=95486 RepID=UPI001B9559D3|nr:hypothetical protein [Burkholderia cenocepacia]MBR8271354.1 hypothetical protein [Burkholderia cenocepacia]
MAEINVALLGFLGVLAGGYVNNFLAEDYRRFRDSRALAGALAGELESHSEAIPLIKQSLETMLMGLARGEKLSLPEWPIPASPLFDENASKIGLLGPESANGVAYVYENIRAFRQSFHLLSKHHSTMSSMWCQSIIVGSLAAIGRAENKGLPLVANLKKHAESRYLSLPETRTQLKFGVAAVITFLMALKVLL